MSIAESADHVGLYLTGCDHDTAQAVFAALQTAFQDSGEGRGAPPGQAAEAASGTTVWSSTLDARTRTGSRSSSAPPLPGPVSIDLHGAADPVRHVREELEHLFSVEDLGTVPGEHELEVRLRLTARGTA
ncbi:hypothetical protein [Streptomyces bambusae]|uniref:Uncharacterized protein n=1 Tax=Streptomyces bambusae TaxID=1550616 RepID=A0ABS6Z4P9_9ACTN|nr:hypothetical protein [Streptomyces bambusae]MBW5482745.1 hypothetical protein [Streptomyces bambusae]